MIITIQCSGGFAGAERQVASVDTRHLASQIASRVSECVNELADWVRLHAAPVGADYLRYELVISGDERAGSRIVVVDDGKPDQRPMSLVNELVALASGA